jgi:uncharacterized protein YjbI with pentapeptide repeats
MNFYLLIFTLLTIKMYAQTISPLSDIEKTKQDGVCINCSHQNANLKGLRLVDLSNSDLRGAQLDGCKMSRTKFTNTNLEGASLNNINSNTNQDTQGSRITLNNANLKNISMKNGNFPGIQIIDSIVDGADFSGSTFAGANIENIDFSNTNLSNTRFINAQLTNVTLPEDPNKLKNISFTNLTTFINLKNCDPSQLGIFAYTSPSPCAQKLCSLGIDITNLTVNGFTFQDGCTSY